MASGALIVGGAYLMLALIAMIAGVERVSWLWLALFFVVFTLGELHILPTGLGLFARLAPPKLGATTVAAWFFATFTGSLMAGFVGALWSRTSHAMFFALLAALGALAAGMLIVLDVRTRRIETARANEAGAGLIPIEPLAG
jgi:POT family proton-dependent oligopeptide transporter